MGQQPVAPSESPLVEEAAIAYYVERQGLTVQQAQDRLRIQEQGRAVLDELRSTLGAQWAESRYDGSDGHLVVGVTPEAVRSGAAGRAADVIERRGLGRVARLEDVPRSEAEMIAAKEEISGRLASLIRDGLAAPSIDFVKGEVVIRGARALTREQRSQIASQRSRGVGTRLVPDGRGPARGPRRGVFLLLEDLL
jgi:hypothetical protein